MALGLDNTTPVLYLTRLCLPPFVLFEKQILSSARPDTLTGIGIFQHEGLPPIVTIPFSRGFFLLSLSFRPP
jgi:hypothetical protein